MPNTLPNEDRDLRWKRIVELTGMNWSARRIAEEVGVSPRTVVRVRKQFGVSLYNPAVVHKFTAEERTRIEAWLDDGWSFAEIARTTGHHATSIARRWKGRSQWAEGRGAIVGRMFARLDAL